MSPAERQARRRAKLRQPISRPPATPVRRITPRPTGWGAAVATLVGLQEEYRAWLDNLPPNLENSTLADKLQTVVELRPRGAATDRSSTRLRSRLIKRWPLTDKAPYKPAPAKAGGTRWEKVRFVLVAYRLLAPGSEWRRLQKHLVDKPWQQARPGVQGKLLPQDGELYVFAQSLDRIAKERAMRRRTELHAATSATRARRFSTCLNSHADSGRVFTFFPPLCARARNRAPNPACP